MGVQTGLDDGLHLALRVALAQGVQCSLRHVAQIDAAPVQFRAGDACQAQQIVDQPCHALRSLEDIVYVKQAVFIQAAGGFISQDLRIAGYAAQRRAQIVGNRVGKGLQLPVGNFQFGSALAHALFQLGVERMQAGFALLAIGDISPDQDHTRIIAFQAVVGDDLKIQPVAIAGQQAHFEGRRCAGLG